MSALRLFVFFAVSSLVLPRVGSAAGSPEGKVVPAPERSPAQIYKAGCASCHGSDGKGLPRHVVGFDAPLPDFTDCSFSTREPSADWGAVVQHGGPARVFDKMMPAFHGALTAGEVEKALEHVRDFCKERACWPPGELNLPRPIITAKAYVEDEAVLSTAVSTEGNHAVMSKLIYETRIPLNRPPTRARHRIPASFRWLR